MMVSATFFTGQSYFNAGQLAEAERTLSQNLQAIAELTGEASSPFRLYRQP